MTDCSIDDLCEEFNVYLMNRFGYKRKPATHNRKTITARFKKFDLYFRYRQASGPWDESTFVLARIGFEEVRQGHGTDLVSFIVSISRKYNISRIGIEESNENSSAFAAALGFHEIYKNHWIVETSNLKQLLQ